MATYTVFADSGSEGYLQSAASNPDAWLATFDSSSYVFWGWYSSTWTYQAFERFDTSAVSGTVQTATLSIYGKSTSFYPASSEVLEARSYDFGGSVTSADYRTRAQLTAATLLASYDTSSSSWIDTGYNVFTSNGGALAAAVNQSGYTYMVLTTDDARTGGPSGTTKSVMSESAAGSSGTSKDPKLVIETATPVLAAVTVAGDSSVSPAATVLRGVAVTVDGATSVVPAAGARLGAVVGPVAGATDVAVSAGVIAPPTATDRAISERGNVVGWPKRI